MSAAQPLPLTSRTSLADPYESAWAVVLARTPRGDDELRRPLMPLGRSQQALLDAIDGRRSLRLLVAQHPALRSARLSRDAARLLAFGLVRQVQGELPRALVVEAMNLTMHLPAAAFAALAPDAPMAPRASTIDGSARWLFAWLALMVVAAILAAWLLVH